MLILWVFICFILQGLLVLMFYGHIFYVASCHKQVSEKMGYKCFIQIKLDYLARKSIFVVFS